jgi:hypothetical protein
VTARPREDRRLWPAVLAGWALVAALLLAASRGAIRDLAFPDPDDAMRLLQVRDWLGGQSWWDVGQHRLGGGAFAMHWSRLVDLPLAAALALAAPLGADAATRVAMVAVPLLTLLAVLALAAALTRRVAGVEPARLAVLVAGVSVPLLFQLRPLRIDHHGWQVALAGAAVLALLARPGARSGALAGAALAGLLTVSLEGLPIAAAIGGVAALAWARQPARRGQLLALVWTLAGGAAVLHLATRGPGAGAPACDAVAPAWIAALATAAAGASVAALGRTLAARLALLALGGAAALATLAALAPDCLRGPFAGLPPLVDLYWYRNVAEGLPIWRQDPAWALQAIGLPLVGLAGAAIAWRGAAGEARARWAMLFAIAAAAAGLALLVTRAAATANLLAVPGAAWLVARCFAARATGPRRALAIAGAMLAAAPGLFASILPGLLAAAPAAAPAGPAVAGCGGPLAYRRLAALPPATVFVPIDAGPRLLAWTRHAAPAGPYHRNPAALERVLTGFMGPPDRARAAVAASGARWLAACPDGAEERMYAAAAPGGLWARLMRGERVGWLQPVTLTDTGLRLYRVRLPEDPGRR